MDDASGMFLSPKRNSGPLCSPVDPYLSKAEARVMRKAEKVMSKSKYVLIKKIRVHGDDEQPADKQLFIFFYLYEKFKWFFIQKSF